MKLTLDEDLFEIVVGMCSSKLISKKWIGNDYYLKLKGIELLMNEEGEVYSQSNTYSEYLSEKYGSGLPFNYEHKPLDKEIEIVFKDVHDNGDFRFYIGYSDDKMFDEYEIWTNKNEVVLTVEGCKKEDDSK